MAKNDARVVIPKNPADLLKLASKVVEKHTTDGASSPLNALNDNKWSVTQPLLAIAQAKHTEAEDLKRKMEEAYKERDKYLPAIIESVKASRDMLLSINKKNPKTLGKWGYEVNDSPKPQKGNNNIEEKTK